MVIVSESILVELLLGALLLFCLFYMYMTSNYSYWKNVSIPFKEPSFPFGTENNWFSLKEPLGQHYQSTYTKFRNEKVVGMFQFRDPYLLVRDPQLLKQILTKDFHHFVDRGMVDPEILPPLKKSMFNMQGEAWKIMRSKLTPAFTSGKMKMMYFLMEACSNEFVKDLELIAEKRGKIDIKDYVARFTTDVIASCAFGLQSNSIKYPENEFRRNGNKIIETPPKFVMFFFLIVMAFPWLIKKLNFFIKLHNSEAEYFFLRLVSDTVAYREKNNIIRNDFIDMLIKIKHNKLYDEETNGNIINDQKEIPSSEPGLTLEEMAAQAILFFGAGFETSAATLSFCLYEISVNSEIQSKMRKEIDAVLIKHEGKANYQALKEMPYMEAVINETLRRYSSLPMLVRQCTHAYKLPDSNFVIPNGMNLIIPVYCIHHDPAYYPDPYKFDPERFTDDKIKTKNNYTFIPFGEGPRMCIGNRFAMMQMKMCLTMLLQIFDLTITEDTPIPLGISSKHFMTTPASPIILKISKRKD